MRMTEWIEDRKNRGYRDANPANFFLAELRQEFERREELREYPAFLRPFVRAELWEGLTTDWPEATWTDRLRLRRLAAGLTLRDLQEAVFHIGNDWDWEFPPLDQCVTPPLIGQAVLNEAVRRGLLRRTPPGRCWVEAPEDLVIVFRPLLFVPRPAKPGRRFGPRRRRRSLPKYFWLVGCLAKPWRRPRPFGIQRQTSPVGVQRQTSPFGVQRRIGPARLQAGGRNARRRPSLYLGWQRFLHRAGGLWGHPETSLSYWDFLCCAMNQAARYVPADERARLPQKDQAALAAVRPADLPARVAAERRRLGLVPSRASRADAPPRRFRRVGAAGLPIHPLFYLHRSCQRWTALANLQNKVLARTPSAQELEEYRAWFEEPYRAPNDEAVPNADSTDNADSSDNTEHGETPS